MSTLPNNILLATDGSEDAVAAALAAVDISNRTGAQLHVVHAWRRPREYSYPGISHDALISVYNRHAEEVLKKELGRIRSAGGTVAEAHLETGRAIDAVLDVADEVGADMILLGSRGLGPVRRVTLGSVSEGVVHHARCPVLVLRRGESLWPPVRIVAGDDGSEDSKRAGELAARIGKLYGIPLLLVRSYPELLWSPDLMDTELGPYDEVVRERLQDAERALEKRADHLEQLTGLRPETKVAVGEAARFILDITGDGEATLIVLGSRGFGAVRRMALGSVSTKVLRAAEGSVMIYPHATL